MKIKWRCTNCGDVVISDSSERHSMDWCKCGKSGYDLEAAYSRTIGKVEKIGEVNG